jgi:medium-chain acyl-[acyl-carrier-protein] hydrolase
MKQVIWTQSYDVNTIVLDSRKQLGLVGLLNLLQDTAWLHARHLGWGYENLISQGTIWVLGRQKLSMQVWPQWGDRVAVRTWPRGATGALATRDFEILVGDRKFGESTTSWLILDMETRRPKKLDRAKFEEHSRKEGVLAMEAGKISLRADLKPAETFCVHLSDLDVNGHVNNTRYAQWILDTLSNDEFEANDVRDYEVNFLSETRVGDTVVIARDGFGPGGAQFQGMRDGKAVFVARLGVQPRP